MVGRRYYCHYCHVSFPYSREGRKRHCSGHTHAKTAALHYQQYHSHTQRYQAETAKQKCRRHLSGQGCNYGDLCIFSHASLQQLDHLRQLADEEGILQEYGPLPSQVTQGNACLFDTSSLEQSILAMKKGRLSAAHRTLVNKRRSVPPSGAACAVGGSPASCPNTTRPALTCENSNMPPSPHDTNNGVPSSAVTDKHIALALETHTGACGGRENIPLQLHNNNILLATSPSLQMSAKLTPNTISTGPGLANIAMTRMITAPLLLPPPSMQSAAAPRPKSLLPPSLRPYDIDTIISVPIPEWG